MSDGEESTLTSDARTSRRFSRGSSLFRISRTRLVRNVVAPKFAPVFTIGRMSDSSHSLPKTCEA
eukprot:3837927-Pleurochrysis_carterae.AAC.1